MKYVIFDKQGFIDGIFLEDISPIPIDSDYALITDELSINIAQKEVASIKKKNSLIINKNFIYSNINDLIEVNTDIKTLIVNEVVDQEKLAMAEAIADMYEMINGIGSV